MPFSLQFNYPIFSISCSHQLTLHNSISNQPFKFLCTSPQSEEAAIDSSGENGKRHVILVEKYRNGTSKRYIIDNDSEVKMFLEEHVPATTGSQHLEIPVTELSWLPKVIKDFVLPAGFPDTVTDDYLDYMLLQFPTNVTGWICHTLVTSSLLKAVGVGSFSGTSAAASAAAIRWVSKDGIGAVGRFFIGGRFGNLFDDDPKQWRMYADFIGSAGSIFDLCTPLYPSYFLPLASLGNLAKAVARGLKDPSFRVIQNHFAIGGNLGDVAAKEEVWEVAAELVGLALGILALDTPGISKSYPTLALTWLSVRILHLWFRYQSLSVLQFNTINLKRARILVNSHVLHCTVPGIDECNRIESILLWQRFLRPRIIFEVSLEEMLDRGKYKSMIKQLINLYKEEKYFLVVHEQKPRDFEVFVSFKEGATSLSVLRSVWQTYWLYQNWGWSDNVFDRLEQSLVELKHRFPDLLQQLIEAGWDANNLSLKVPKEMSIEELPAL
ncbi:PREDICTED: protein root UVB sensitive 5 isoform X2 [Nicotiana attenuata]|uniref:protein root UVB sensitive 5 isoform X2 n=1 Tax=Nicotiana attenuata TaxID=49451 RepID=UPI0009052FD6|nr:PREDICTED: protein root UVB sensitive 5 isoform X2 [Nicotiana attenuata]